MNTSFKLSIVTWTICGLCLLIFAVATIKLISKKCRIKIDINAAKSGNINNLINGVYDNYLAVMKGNNFTSEYASDYINLETVAEAYKLNLKRMNVVPNILTSLGILGTFLGLSIAVIGFDSETSEGIKASIQTLLSGMSTAFITSVFGMSCSMSFLFIERGRINELSRLIDKFCSALDKKYHCSIDSAVIRAFSYEDEEGHLYQPVETLQFVREDVKKMRKQLETFGTDICDNIGNALDASFQEKLVPIINDLSKKLENPAQAVTDGLIQELKKVCDDFSNNVTQGVNDKMDDLLERFIDASNSISTLPDTVDTINKSLSISTKDTVLATQAVSEVLDNQIPRLNDLVDSFGDALENLRDVSVTITELHEKIESLPNSVSEATTAIALAAGEIKESQKGVNDAVEGIKDVNEATKKVVDEYIGNVKEIQNGLSEIFAEINTGLNQYSDSVKASLQGMLDPFTSSVTDATSKVANAIAPLNDAVTDLGGFSDKVRAVLIDVETSFSHVETVLKQLAEIKMKASEEVTKETEKQA